VQHGIQMRRGAWDHAGGPEECPTGSAAQYYNSRAGQPTKKQNRVEFGVTRRAWERMTLQVEIKHGHGMKRQFFFDRRAHLI